MKTDNISREWRPVPIEEYVKYYEVSNFGEVRSLDRGSRKGRILKDHQISNKAKYRFVSLSNRSFKKSARVHRLVAMAFIPNPNNYPSINHIDGDAGNNIVTNLEWCTNSYNIQHAYETLGKMSSLSRLTPKIVRNVRKDLSRGLSRTQVARKYGMSNTNVGLIALNKIWKEDRIDIQEKRILRDLTPER